MPNPERASPVISAVPNMKMTDQNKKGSSTKAFQKLIKKIKKRLRPEASAQFFDPKAEPRKTKKY